ncbi:MAG TPA: hypothetical protein VHV77_04325 [Pirellulales bacterium]|jgi:hypothetical protein|nr:hypothetical protein [Pirellulales bacterium]
MFKTLAIAVCSIAVAFETASGAPPTVGMPRQIAELVLPGSELEVRPLEDRHAPLVLRVTRSVRHGSAWRYDLAWYGLEVGSYDLRDALRRKDGSSIDDVPSLPVTVASALPPTLTLPHDLPPQRVTGFGHYRLVLGVLATAWVAGLAVLLWFGRGRGSGVVTVATSHPLTLADRIRPLVARGVAGTITPSECATLERLLLQFWSQRLGLQQQKPAQLIPQLRIHSEAGPLVRQLEHWLHQPAANQHVGDETRDAHHIDLDALVSPYLQASGAESTVPTSNA